MGPDEEFQSCACNYITCHQVVNGLSPFYDNSCNRANRRRRTSVKTQEGEVRIRPPEDMKVDTKS